MSHEGTAFEAKDADWEGVDHALRGFLRARGLSASDADDVLQTAFLRVLKGLDRLQAPSAFEAFVFATTRNALADHFRRAPRDQPAEDLPEPVAEAEEDSDEEAVLARAALAGWLRAEIHRLPEPVRSTLIRTELEGCTHRAVADAEGVSVSAIKSRVSRGRKELKRRLQLCCEVELDARQGVTAITPRQCC